MTPQEIDRIQNAIRHIQTAVDVDPWAAQIAVDAMEKQIPKKIISKDDDDYGDCPVCGKILRYRSEAYCYNCGQKYVWKVVEG